MIAGLSTSIAHTAASSAIPATCFVYGTLMAPEVLTSLIGRVPPMLHRVKLRNHSRHPVRGCVYPGVIPVSNNGNRNKINDAYSDNTINNDDGDATTKENSVEGVLLLDISPLEMKYLDYFEEEGVDYIRTAVAVDVPCSNSNIKLLQSTKLLQSETINDESASSIISTKSHYLQFKTNVYVWARPDADLYTTKEWDYDNFRREQLASYLERVVNPCRIEFEELLKGNN